MLCDWICFLSNELCVFYPPALARKHIMSWIKIICNHKPYQILFMMLQHHFFFKNILVAFLNAKFPYVISLVLRYNPL